MIAISCPDCGATAWLTGEPKCKECGGVLRRCTDCANFDARHRACRTLKIELDAGEVSHPTVLAVSALCPSYAPLQPRLAA